MKKPNDSLKELTVILFAAIVLAITFSFKNNAILFGSIISFIIIISANTIIKKLVAYYFEIKLNVKFWSWYRYGFRKDAHFKVPVPMLWLPLVLSAITKGIFCWLAILEFDVDAKAERATKRHGLYRFTEVTEWHIALIAVWGIAINLILAVIGYILGFETFAKISVFYAAWSLIPLSSLDGSKIFFGSRILWTIITTITVIFLGWGLAIVA